VVRALRVTAFALVAAGLLAGCGAVTPAVPALATQTTYTRTPQPLATGGITVWLPAEAAGWPSATAAATGLFHQTYPNVTVAISYRAEPAQLSAFAAAAYASDAPTVIAVDATDAHHEIIAGAFTNLTSVSSTFDGRLGWNSRLVSSCSNQNSLYCVPFSADLVLAIPAGGQYGDWAEAWMHAATSTSVQRMIMGD
jgi:N,N'-diacetylchitobiose transport system substrate-binding protein